MAVSPLYAGDVLLARLRAQLLCGDDGECGYWSPRDGTISISNLKYAWPSSCSAVMTVSVGGSPGRYGTRSTSDLKYGWLEHAAALQR